MTSGAAANTSLSDWLVSYSTSVEPRIHVNLRDNLPLDRLVYSLRFSPDGKFLAMGSNRLARIYDITNSPQITKMCELDHTNADNFNFDTLPIRSVCFTPDGSRLITAADDAIIRVWEIAEGHITCGHSLRDHQWAVNSLAVSHDGHFLVSGSSDNTVKIWTSPSSLLKDESPHVLRTMEPQDGSEIPSLVGLSVAISVDDQLVAAGSPNAEVYIWHVATGNLVIQLHGHCHSVVSVAFSPDGEGLVSASLDKTLKYWNIAGLSEPESLRRRRRREYESSPRCTKTYKGHRNLVYCMAVSPNGRWVVSGCSDNSVGIWEQQSAWMHAVLYCKGAVLSVDVSPNGDMLAIASGSGGVWTGRVPEATLEATLWNIKELLHVDSDSDD